MFAFVVGRIALCSHLPAEFQQPDKSLKTECIRPKTPLDLDEAKRLVAAYVSDYNYRRLHSAIGYVAPADKLAGKAPTIHADRERKLSVARQRRAERRRARSEQPVAHNEIVA